MLEGITIGVGSAVATGFIAFLTAHMIRQWSSPKRLDRLEKVIPVMVRSMLAILKCQKRASAMATPTTQ